MPNINKFKLLSERTSGAPPVIFYKDIKESNKQILETVLFCNGILTLTDSWEKQSSALSKSMNNRTKCKINLMHFQKVWITAHKFEIFQAWLKSLIARQSSAIASPDGFPMQLFQITCSDFLQTNSYCCQQSKQCFWRSANMKILKQSYSNFSDNLTQV